MPISCYSLTVMLFCQPKQWSEKYYLCIWLRWTGNIKEKLRDGYKTEFLICVRIDRTAIMKESESYFEVDRCFSRRACSSRLSIECMLGFCTSWHEQNVFLTDWGRNLLSQYMIAVLSMGTRTKNSVYNHTHPYILYYNFG